MSLPETLRNPSVRFALAFFAAAVASLGAPASAAAQGPADASLRMRIVAALESASDLPADSLSVQVRDGVVTVTGTVVCDECGGRRTPGGSGTVQQSLGAVIRAIPGVTRVEFSLRYRPAPGPGGGPGR